MTKKDGDRFNVVPAPDSETHQSLIKDPGVVSGEITSDPQVEARMAGLMGLQAAFLSDAQLNSDWEATELAPSGLARIEALLDRLNAHRQELAASDADLSYKDARARLLSDLSNRLRELI